jgi:hypothetical protein
MAKTTTPTRPTTTRQTVTVTVGGKRMVLTTRDGKVTAKPAPVLEWVLQAAAVRALRAMPEYAAGVDQVATSPTTSPAPQPCGAFTLAGDFNAGRRSMSESAKAKATGLVAGEHDLRIYLTGGRVALLEFKGVRTPVSAEQRARHALLAALGHTRQAIVRAATEGDAASQAVTLVRGWLAEGAAEPAAANDNYRAAAEKAA